MSNFLRGGQVTAHRVRMTFQVIRIMVRITLCVMLLTIFLTFKNNIESYEWKMIPALLAKYTFQDLNPEKTVAYTNKWGIELKEKVKYLAWNSDFTYVEKHFSHVFLISVKRLIWVVFFSLSFAMIYFWIRGRVLQTNNQIRGSFLISEKELRNKVTKHNRKFIGLKSYTFADIPYFATGKSKSYTPGEQAHTLVLGATGSGKTKVIQDLVQQIDAHGSKAIIVDIKGDYIRHFYDSSRGDVILNPLDKRGANWSFFKETDVLKGFDTIAKTLIPDSYGDPFWANSARMLFSALASLYSNKNLSIAEFSRTVLNTDLETLEKQLKNSKAKHLVNQKADKTVACVLMMLSVYLAPFRLYNKSNNIFSIKDWVNDQSKNNFLFISTSPDVKGSLNPLVQMQVDLAINALCSSKSTTNQQVWFILDELAYFDGGITNLKDGLTTSRSFGGAFVLGAQDLSSLSKIYGNDLSRVITNNCRTKFIMNVDDSYTSKWCSDLFGEGEVEEWREGLSYGAHQMRDGVTSNRTNVLKKTILSSEFSQLSTGSGYMKLPEFHPALVKFREFYLEDKTESFIENEQLKKTLKKEMKKAKSDREELEKEMLAAKGNIEEGKEIADEALTKPKVKDNQIEATF
jgi:type IV conjugative transfer system coupling protein TraD